MKYKAIVFDLFETLITEWGHKKYPGVIKYPFWQMTAANPKAIYACVNYGEAVCPKEIADQAVCMDGDILFQL